MSMSSTVVPALPMSSFDCDVSTALPDWTRNTYGSMGFSSHQRGSWPVEARALSVDGILVSSITSGAHEVTRSSEQIGLEIPRQNVNIMTVTHGVGLLEQGRRVTQLQAGDVVFNDPDAPLSLSTNDDFGLVFFIMPRQLLGLSLQELDAVSARPVNQSVPSLLMVQPFLAQFATLFAVQSSETTARLVHSAVELIRVLADELVASARQADPGLSDEKSLLSRAKTFITENIADPELSPQRVADALYITPRHLHNTFRSEDITVARWIRRLRLDGCRRDLADTARSDIKVALVGKRWGLSDPSHFSRLFRQQFGVTPGRYAEAMRSAQYAPDFGRSA